MVEAGSACHVRGADDAAGRTAEDGADGLKPRQVHGDGAARRLHHAHGPSEPLAQPVEVARHQRADVGVHDDGAGALVLPELRQHLARRRDERGGVGQRFGEHALVIGMEEREQQADRHGLGLERPHPGRDVVDLVG